MPSRSSGHQAGNEWAWQGGNWWHSGSGSWGSWASDTWHWKGDNQWQWKDTEATSAKDTSQDSHVGEAVAWNHAQREQVGACEGSLPSAGMLEVGIGCASTSAEAELHSEDCRDALCALLNNSGLVSDTYMQPWTDASLFKVVRQDDSSLFVASCFLPSIGCRTRRAALSRLRGE